MSADGKREAIIAAALRRFGHFGVPKTTMSEIAADLSISKPLLYYYFPDKMSLYAAVLDQIITEGAGNHDAELAAEPDPFRAMDRYLEQRTDFILKYYQLLEYLKGFTPHTLPEPLVRLFEPIRKREVDRIIAIVDNGRSLGKFKLDSVRKTSELYFEFLDAFRNAFIAQQPNFFPDKKQFAAILKREKEFTRIFMNGLTCDR